MWWSERGHGPNLVTLTELADLLGVSTNQTWTWHDRRASNGFPAPVGSVLVALNGGPRRGPLFNADEVLAWHETYRPRARSGAHWAAKRAAKENAR